MSAINKILVIGAGIAGPAVCYWLRRFGFSPILIEKSANLRKGGHPVDIRGVAIDLVKKMGIYEDICTFRTQDAIEGVPYHFNQLIESMKQRDNDVEVRFKDGRTDHYHLVIGADGLPSTTRSMVFHKDEYKLINLGAYFCTFSI